MKLENGEIVKRYPKCKDYLISSHGRVWSKITNKWLEIQNHKRGYKKISLSMEGNPRINFFIHRLVAETYLGEIDNKRVNHIDGNKINNWLVNLEIIIAKEKNKTTLDSSLKKLHHNEIVRSYPHAKDYLISTHGRVWSKKSNKWLKNQQHKNGYLKVSLSMKENPRINFFIHRLVAETFKGEINTEMQINHIDGDKVNNKLENLEIVTPQENMKHAQANSLMKKSRRKRNNFDKYKVTKIIQAKNNGIPVEILAKRYGFSTGHIHRIIKGEVYKHIIRNN